MSCVEWTVFVCTHTLGHQWKTAFGAAPQWVKTVMDNGWCHVTYIQNCKDLYVCSTGFYTPIGVFTIAGLHVLPAYLYFLQHIPEPWTKASPALLYAPLLVLGTGRALAMAVEVSELCLCVYIPNLVQVLALWRGCLYS